MTQKQIDAYLKLMDPQILEERTHQDKSGVWEDCINNSLPVNIRSEPIRWPVWLHPHRRQWKRILPD